MKTFYALAALLLSTAQATPDPPPSSCSGSCSETKSSVCTECEVQYTYVKTTRQPTVTSSDIATVCSFTKTQPCPSGCPTTGAPDPGVVGAENGKGTEGGKAHV